MNVVYEEDGALKVGAVMATEAGTLQVESVHGKRSKIKADKVLLEFGKPALGELLPAAQELQTEIDLQFLWECAGTEEQGYLELAKEFFGPLPTSQQAAAMLWCLWNSPMHFHKKGRGRFKAASTEQLQSALKNAERKKQQEAKLALWVTQLMDGQLPAEFAQRMPALMFKPDPSWLEQKAVLEACQKLHMTPLRLFVQCGALQSAHDYFVGRFLQENFPKGRGFSALPEPESAGELPLAAVQAFSIDDKSTTEIDDAFSVTRLPDGNLRIGIHIAAPGLGILPDSPLDQVARQRMSTVYMPGDKITMLPESVSKAYSLDAGRSCPAVSLYLTVSGDGSYRILTEDTRLERVPIAANLRYPGIDEQFSPEAIASGQLDFPFGDDLRVLYELALRLVEQRGKAEQQDQIDYLFFVKDGPIRIVPRLRGAPVDRVVSELMIYVNSAWGKLLGDRDIRALFRVQEGGKVRLSLYPAAHLSLGVSQYLWGSSPLRRYCDLLNQWQLVAHLYGEPPPFEGREADLQTIMRDFEALHSVYDEFQRNMERYWCVRYLQQEQQEQLTATVLRDNLVRFDTLPLWQRVPSLPELPAGTHVNLEITKLDEYELTLHCEYRGKV